MTAKDKYYRKKHHVNIRLGRDARKTRVISALVLFSPRILETVYVRTKQEEDNVTNVLMVITTLQTTNQKVALVRKSSAGSIRLPLVKLH